MEKSEKYGVYSISKCVKNKVKKNLWLRLGSGTFNSDGSFSICLGALPLTDPKTGFINLHMRKLIQNRDDGANQKDKTDTLEASINVELDPFFGLPTEAM